MSRTAGADAIRAKGREWEQQRKTRAKRAAAQKAAKDAMAYDDAPNRMTPADLIAHHRQLKADCLRRMNERQAA